MRSMSRARQPRCDLGAAASGLQSDDTPGDGLWADRTPVGLQIGVCVPPPPLTGTLVRTVRSARSMGDDMAASQLPATAVGPAAAASATSATAVAAVPRESARARGGDTSTTAASPVVVCAPEECGTGVRTPHATSACVRASFGWRERRQCAVACVWPRDGEHSVDVPRQPCACRPSASFACGCRVRMYFQYFVLFTLYTAAHAAL